MDITVENRLTLPRERVGVIIREQYGLEGELETWPCDIRQPQELRYNDQL